MLDLLERGPVFMGSIDNFERSEVVLIELHGGYRQFSSGHPEGS